MSAVLIPILALAIPIVAIAGGITVAIVRTIGQQRVAELAMRERIAAIEKGLDPATLPALPQVGDPSELGTRPATPRDRALATAEGLAIAAVITAFSGAGLAIFLAVIAPDGRKPIWVVGVLVLFVAAGLGVASLMVRRNAPPAPGPAPAPGAPGVA